MTTATLTDVFTGSTEEIALTEIASTEQLEEIFAVIRAEMAGLPLNIDISVAGIDGRTVSYFSNGSLVDFDVGDHVGFTPSTRRLVFWIGSGGYRVEADGNLTRIA